MVVNLCLPHFNTTIKSNKRMEVEDKDVEIKKQRAKVLCADGYDVTNLVSADPALRRRGFKLEYFLRPPFQVTLKFDFRVELCRVDVELWPWGMDRGQTSKKIEISTSSDPLPPQTFGHGQGHKQGQQKQGIQMQVQNQTGWTKEKQQEQGNMSCKLNGQWGFQAETRGEEALGKPQQRGNMYRCQKTKEHAQSGSQPSNSEPDFKLVGRCVLTEETQVCFSRSPFCPRPPFLSPPPAPPVNCRTEELWSRGLLSLGSVTQLCVTVPFGGAASALGLKALTVWGQPARCCSREEVEKIKNVHKASEQPLPRPVPSVSQTKTTLQDAPARNFAIPEEFLDPITQDVMTLPMLLPSGVSVDNSTLEEYQKREATWGRLQNDPFTGVPFTGTSQPLPNPLLKGRIDHFLLQKGDAMKDGMLGRRGETKNPQPSRLIASVEERQSQNFQFPYKNFVSNTTIQYDTGTKHTRTVQIEDTAAPGHSSDNGNDTSDSKLLSKRKKRYLSEIPKESTGESTAENAPQTKRPRDDTASVPSCSSHEQRLSASLDEALSSVLRGRPSFTSNVSRPRQKTPPVSEPLDTSQQFQTTSAASVPTGVKTCSACSCALSIYSASASPAYRLVCGHLLCRACLHRESQPLSSVTPVSNGVLCPTCRSPTSRSDIIRVHH